jgi:hypothetical protein
VNSGISARSREQNCGISLVGAGGTEQSPVVARQPNAGSSKTSLDDEGADEDVDPESDTRRIARQRGRVLGSQLLAGLRIEQ